MATPQDVKNFIKTKLHLMGEVQLHKLVYYSQAWNMVWNGPALFDEEIEAWKWGPVVPSLRYTSIATPAGAFDLDKSQQAAVAAVVEHYGIHYGWALSEQTHQELPWIITRGELTPGSASDRPIPRSLMRTYYTEQSMRGEGPRKPTSLAVSTASDDVVLAIARRNQRRWAGARALLAE